jgi:hypothetical protein
LDGGVSGLDPGCNRLAGIRHLWEASTARNLVASTQVLAVLVLRHQRWLRGCLAGNLVTGNPVAGTPRQPDPAPVGLARAQFDSDPAGGAEGCRRPDQRQRVGPLLVPGSRLPCRRERVPSQREDGGALHAEGTPRRARRPGHGTRAPLACMIEYKALNIVHAETAELP